MSWSSPSSPASDPAPEYREQSSGTDSAPFGIYLIAILGGFISLLGFIPILVLLGQGGGAFLLGLVLFAINVGQLYVLVGLVGLKPWAWTWALILYGIGGLFRLIEGDVIGLVISIVIIAYLLSKADLYER